MDKENEPPLPNGHTESIGVVTHDAVSADGIPESAGLLLPNGKTKNISNLEKFVHQLKKALTKKEHEASCTAQDLAKANLQLTSA